MNVRIDEAGLLPAVAGFALGTFLCTLARLIQIGRGR